MTGAQALVAALAANGVRMVFCVPGESYLAVLDALLDADIQIITCRHEAAAANMAEAYGKLTGKPGVCMVTRGPGATQAAIGVHTAFQDSTPMVLFVGQVAQGDKHREAFQELDYGLVFAGLAKRAEEASSAARLPEYVMRAFSAAQNGRPGPVVLALPEDILAKEAEFGPAPVAPLASQAADLSALEPMLREAKRPFLLVGGPGWTAEAVAGLRRVADAWRIPVGTSFRAKDLIDNRHLCYAGDVGIGPNPKLTARVQGSDLLIVLGARLGEMTTNGYTLLTSPVPAQRIVHIHASAEELGRVYQPELAVHAAPPAAIAAFERLTATPGDWAAWTNGARADYEDWVKPVDVTGAVNLSHVMAHLDAALPPDAIVANGAGNFAIWLHRFYQHKAWKTQLGPTSGAMGYGLPAGIAAKLAEPERTVVAVCGDGDFLMSSNDLATAVRYGVNLVTLVVNNGAYGTIRMHQEKHYPGRVSATELTNPDFVKYAESFGCAAWRVTKTDEFPAAFEAALNAGKPALIELVTSAEDIAPGRTIGGMRG